MPKLLALLALGTALVGSCMTAKKPRESAAAPVPIAIADTGGQEATGGSTPGGGASGGSTGEGSGGAGGTGSSAPAACASDADCRLFADMCTACDCRALGRKDSDPTCAGPGVRCFADPCLKKKAACQKERCVVVSATGYDPCAGKKCGESCKICPPSDPSCMETLEVKQCSAEGKCSSMPPGCGGK
jgi:hypothetical protein